MSPNEFDRLRAEVLELRAPRAPLVHAWYSPPDEHGTCAVVELPATRETALLNELMTQAAHLAGIPIGPGETAPDVWVPLLVDYETNIQKSRRLRRSVTQSIRDVGLYYWLTLPAFPEVFELAPEPIYERSEHPEILIADVIGVAADYLQRLKTESLARPAEGAQSLASAETRPPTGVPSAKTLHKWSDVTIVIISDFTIQVLIAGVPGQLLNFTEAGLGDRRGPGGENPRRAWFLLKLLADTGKIPLGANRTQTEKRVQELRKALRDLVSATGDPLPLKHESDSVCWRAVFKIRRTRE